MERLVDRLLTIEPPSWRTTFHETGRLLPGIFAGHEEVGLARLQNDLLIALTARHTGARLVALDRHFSTLGRHVKFSMILLD